MDGCVRVRPGAWIRIFIRSAADAAIRRIAFVNFPALFQCGRRAWTDSDARVVYSRIGAAVPLRCRRTRWDDHSVGTRYAHRLALDDGARNCFKSVSLSMAGIERWPARARHALDDGAGNPGRNVLAALRAIARPDRSRYCAESVGCTATTTIATDRLAGKRIHARGVVLRELLGRFLVCRFRGGLIIEINKAGVILADLFHNLPVRFGLKYQLRAPRFRKRLRIFNR